MPELPEVEVTRRRLLPHVVGRTIRSLQCSPPSYFFLTPPTVLQAKLGGKTIADLRRQGKYLLLHLTDGQRLLLHLGMTGQLFLEGSSSPRLLTLASHPEGGSPARFRPDHHTHLQLHFEGGFPALLFRDMRKFGKVRLIEKGRSDARLDKLGPDALTVTGELLFDASRKRRVAIKSLLLDQSIISGVGNIYADESLFRAGVRPTRVAARVTRRECDALARGLRQVLLRSIETGGSSISDFIGPDGADGGYQNERHVYARRGEPCVHCGAPIARVVVGQRSSHYCPRCQKR